MFLVSTMSDIETEQDKENFRPEDYFSVASSRRTTPSSSNQVSPEEAKVSHHQTKIPAN